MGCDAVMSKIKFINPTTAAIEALNIEAKSIEALKHTIIKLYSTTNYWLRTTVLLYYYYYNTNGIENDYTVVVQSRTETEEKIK